MASVLLTAIMTACGGGESAAESGIIKIAFPGGPKVSNAPLPVAEGTGAHEENDIEVEPL